MTRNQCRKCGAGLKRIHRTLAERLRYYGVFQCSGCGERFARRRHYLFFLGPSACCPKCGTRRIKKLHKPDRIDPLYRNVFSLAQRLFPGARLHHCAFCRIQFWDRRPARAQNGQAVTADKATQGV
jgi:hypothetical protein